MLFKIIFNHFNKINKPTKQKLPEPLFLEKNNHTIPIIVKINNRVKNIKIKMTPRQEVELIIPNITYLRLAKLFLSDKKEWIFNRLAHNKSKKINLIIGNVIPMLGQEYKICHNGILRGNTYIDNNQIIVSGREDTLTGRVKRFLITELTREIINYTKQIENDLKIKAKKITIRDNVSNWGSCSTTGNLSFSWRLVFAPLSVLHYVIIHELCHLIEHNHSKKYWQLVASICPDYVMHKQWLKKNGGSLYRYI